MVYDSGEMEQRAVLEVASLMCAAARTAPKAKGMDNIVTKVLTGEEIVKISDKMRQISLREFGKEDAHFTGDGRNILKAQAIVLIGVRRRWYGLPYCSMCGFKSCGECKKANANCVFAPMDLGIALGSAAAVAADMRVDSRIMFSIGKAAEEMGYAEDQDVIWQGIPLSIAGKNVFFDRANGR